MITQQELKERVHYTPETGIFVWKVGIRKGQRAGTFRSGNYGVRRVAIGVKGTKYFAHRLAHLYMTGAFPVDEIDHINGNSLDNRWCNLREVNRRVNCRNCKQKINVSATGESCVYWRHDRGYYQVRVRTTLKRISVSNIATLEEAVIVRNNLWKENDYHPNHNRKQAGEYCG
jgi:hypothetical protein